MGERLIDTGYEPFSQEPEYIELNRSFMRSLLPYLGRCQRILDLACGTGTLTELLLEEMQASGVGVGGARRDVFRTTVLGLDISRESLKVAQRRFWGLDCPIAVGFVEASAEAPPVGSLVFELTLMGNAIHCLSDKDALAKEVGRMLRPGGLFAFNSSFYSGTIISGTEEFYHQWMKTSLEYIRQKDQESRRQGLGGIVRVRGRGKPAFSSRWLSPAEYTVLLQRNGFEVKSVSERVYAMSQRNFESVGAYAGLASVLLSGYPAPVACEALERSVGPAFATVGAEVIRRSSLEVVAVKR